jgi:hypothetical protein
MKLVLEQKCELRHFALFLHLTNKIFQSPFKPSLQNDMVSQKMLYYKSNVEAVGFIVYNKEVIKYK